MYGPRKHASYKGKHTRLNISLHLQHNKEIVYVCVIVDLLSSVSVEIMKCMCVYLCMHVSMGCSDHFKVDLPL